MPVNKIVATKRGKAAIASVLAVLAAGGYSAYTAMKTPPAVIVATEKLIKPWEGISLKPYVDMVGVRTWCWGETKGTPKASYTRDECDAMLIVRVNRDYYGQIIQCAPKLPSAPISVQASMISGSYNFGVRAWCNSTAARMIRAENWRGACEAQTAFNKAGGQVVNGLVRRREMGDAQRLGEAELCVSGL
ncbi:MAG: glycoside hydrolase [Shinella sp.]|nr:MAG: glycoside hydrolase [Shinella sp.]